MPSQHHNRHEQNNETEKLGCIAIPKLIVPLRYLSILFTAIQYYSVGLLVNLQTLLTEKLISGLVIVVAYRRAPTTDL